jgi:HEAT repeat protein
VIVVNGGRRVLVRLIDAETGEILAAAEAEMPEEDSAAPASKKDESPLFPYSRIVDGALALLDGASGGPEVEDRLAGILETRGGGERRAAAALALGRLADSRSLGLLVFAAEDGEPAVRGAAALALGLRGDPAAILRLEALLRSDPDWRVRDAAAAGLFRARPDGAAGQALSTLIAEH